MLNFIAPALFYRTHCCGGGHWCTGATRSALCLILFGVFVAAVTLPVQVMSLAREYGGSVEAYARRSLHVLGMVSS